jgi:hypothetical protein
VIGNVREDMPISRPLMLRREGHEEEARAEMEAARQSFRRMGMKTWLDRAEASLEDRARL